MPELIPAILTDDLHDFKDKLKKLDGLTEWVQIDIMDGKFVKNTSVKLGDLVGIEHNFNFEAHLMVANPQNYFKSCKKLKCQRVLFHFEAVKDPLKILEEMNSYDFAKGISINPPTAVEDVVPYLDMVDVVLLLAVNPGWQGQKFDPIVFKKIEKIRETHPQKQIAIDGGVNMDNIKKVVKAGFDIINIGSAIFNNDQAKENIKAFKAIIK